MENSDVIELKGKIVKYNLVDKVAPIIESMNEEMKRPEYLLGSTYKIKTPQSDHALYITINDFILNRGTEFEERRPYEIFINSKNVEHFQWVVALTRVISAVFRKGGDITFLVEELKEVFDPKGGYFKRGGIFMPSLVAEIGCAIEQHLKIIGILQADTLSDAQKEFIKSKHEGDSFPDNAKLCNKCSTKAVILMDGCMTCLNCADSKCG